MMTAFQGITKLTTEHMGAARFNRPPRPAKRHGFSPPFTHDKGTSMSDTKRMELIAENLISHFLQRHGILVAKPYFDQDAGDLFAITTVGGIRFCRIQCKGRKVRPSAGNNVEISVAVNLESFVVCLFIDDGSFDSLNLYAFFGDEIAKWNKNSTGDKYILCLAHGTFVENLKQNKVSERTIDRIGNEIMKAELPTTVHYKFTSSGGFSLDGTATAKM